MKNAIEAKMIGCSTETSTKKSELVRLFRWKSQPTQNSRTDTAPRYRRGPCRRSLGLEPDRVSVS